MPFSKIDPNKFTLDAVKDMQVAFDAVCLEMNLDQTDARRSKLAMVIIRLMNEGDMSALKERALDEMIQLQHFGV
jgi:hypothetical protein